MFPEDCEKEVIWLGPSYLNKNTFSVAQIAVCGVIEALDNVC